MKGGAVGVGRAVNAAVVAAARRHHDLRLPAHAWCCDDARVGIDVARRALDGALLRRVVAAHRRRRAGAAGAPRGEVLRQMYQIGNRSLLFVSVTLGFIGMVLVYQTCLQVNRVTGDLSQVGAEFIKILVHEFGPSLTAMMLATRVGAGIAAEIGSMVVTEQVDALRMSGVEPIDYLIVPRFLASLVMTGVLDRRRRRRGARHGRAHRRTQLPRQPVRLLRPRRACASATSSTGVIKCVAYGAAIPIVAGFCGLARARRLRGRRLGDDRARSSARRSR